MLSEVTMNEKILRLHDVIAITGLSRSTIYAEIAKGDFPKQIRLTRGRSVGWYSSAVYEWVDSRKVVCHS